MDFVAGKIVQVSIVGFMIASGFTIFKSVDDYVRTGSLPTSTRDALHHSATPLDDGPPVRLAPRPPIRQLIFSTARIALEEGARTAKVVAVGTAAAGVVGALRYSPDDERFFQLQRDAPACAAGAGAAVYAFLDDLPLRTRAGAAVGTGILVASGVMLLARRRASGGGKSEY